jgi:copper/silver efflux system protein
VNDAKRVVAESLALPPGYRLQWTGQYEFMAETRDRLRVVLPLTIAIVLLLYLSLRGVCFWLATRRPARAARSSSKVPTS